MRCPVIFLLLWGAVAAPSAVIAAERPIPQDPKFIEQRFQELLTWNRQTLGDSYRQTGKKDSRWDQPAEKALDLAARMFSVQKNPYVHFSEIYATAREAVDAGCEDPLVYYLYATRASNPSKEDYARGIRKSHDLFLASPSPPLRQAAALEKLMLLQDRPLNDPPTPENVRTIETEVDEVFDLLTRSLKVDPRGEFWEALWYDVLTTALVKYRRLDADWKRTFDRFDTRLAAIPGTEALRLTIRGQFFTDWGWQARTRNVAALVSEKQFETFAARLDEARSALEAAYKLNPKQPCVAQIMLMVEKGIGQGDRDAMERWFQRALELDPDDYQSCLLKLDWLDPKWHGDPAGEEMLEFGRSCAATRNVPSQIPLLAAHAILNHAITLPPPERKRYYSQPENWKLIADAFDDRLRYHPTDSRALSKYAQLAFLCGHPDVAHEMFQRVGDQLTEWPEYPVYPLVNLQWTRAAAARWAQEHQQPGNQSPKP